LQLLEIQGLDDSKDTLPFLDKKKLGSRSISQVTLSQAQSPHFFQTNNDSLDEAVQKRKKGPSLAEDIDKLTQMSSQLQAKMQHPQSINQRWLNADKTNLNASQSLKTFNQGA